MTGKIRELLDSIISERSKGNSAIIEMTKAKFILKGIKFDQYTIYSDDEPATLEKLIEIQMQLHENSAPYVEQNMRTAYSIISSESEAVLEIKSILGKVSTKLLIYFASSSYDQFKMSSFMQAAFPESIVIGCSTAGEICKGKMLNKSVVAMAISANVISDAKVEVIEKISINPSVDKAFKSFEHYFKEHADTMNPTRYFGIILVDGLCLQQEILMDQIGNKTNVYFVGGSAGDDLKFVKTFVCANGEAYTNSAILVMLKLNNNAEFSIIKTQSFRKLDRVFKVSKVNTETREIIELDNKPAIEVYADAVGAISAEDAPNYFMTNPLGLVIGDNELFVRSPQRKVGMKIEMYCNLLAGMEVNLLESTNIIDDTRTALETKRKEFGQIEGIINFNCTLRTQELEKENLISQYGELFQDYENVGFSTYGEEYIGHINQTATMLVFRTGNNINIPGTQNKHIQGRSKTSIDDLLRKIDDLHKEIQVKNQQLDETTSALRQFNVLLEEEIAIRTARENEIVYLSYHDVLTNLYNRRFYEEEIKRLDIERNLPISIVMGDVNELKRMNDNYGHDCGDELLIKTAEGIKRACRADDIIARHGGDEFVILLPRTSLEEAENLIKRIQQQYIDQAVQSQNIRVSFGAATKTEKSEDILNTIRDADNIMYQNKKRQNFKLGLC